MYTLQVWARKNILMALTAQVLPGLSAAANYVRWSVTGEQSCVENVMRSRVLEAAHLFRFLDGPCVIPLVACS